MFDEPSPISMTHNQHMGDGCSVTIQHCDFVLPNGDFCNAYLGVNYPSSFCVGHR